MEAPRNFHKASFQQLAWKVVKSLATTLKGVFIANRVDFYPQKIRYSEMNKMKNRARNETETDWKMGACLFLMFFYLSYIFCLWVSNSKRAFWSCQFFLFFPIMAITSLYSQFSVAGAWLLLSFARSLQCSSNSCWNRNSGGIKFGRKAYYLFHSGVLFWQNFNTFHSSTDSYQIPRIPARIDRNPTGIDKEYCYLGSILHFYFRDMFWNRGIDQNSIRFKNLTK